MCDRLEHGGAGDPARHIREALDGGRIDSGTMLAASLARDQQRIRTGATHLGLAPDLLWLVAELGVGPVAYRLQARLFGEGDAPARPTEVDGALAAWDRGYCPACGSWPAIAEAWQGEHRLRCSFCGAAWLLQTYRCAYCREDGERFVTAAPDLEQPGRRLELCGSCQGYLKAIDVVEPTPCPLLSIEDLATMDLDLAAIERGYGRPPLLEIGSALVWFRASHSDARR